jgi:5-methylthioadenosine/S-adenosylhomocysteine deaminase
MYDLLIRDVILVDPDAATTTIRPGHDIAVTANRVAAVQPTGALGPADAHTVIDGAGMAALPGLINAHAHMAMVLLRGAAEDVTVEQWFNDYIWSMETNMTPEDVYWGAMLAAVEMIESGVTTVADHYFAMDEIARAVETSGMRGELAPTMFGRNPRAELDAIGEFAARWSGAANGRIRAWLGPHAPYTCSADFLREAAAEARTLGLGNSIHVSERPHQVQASLAQHGMTPVQLLEHVGMMDAPLLCAHATFATDDDIRLFAANGVGVAHCPKTYMRLASGHGPVLEMRRQDVRLGLGTDGAASNSTLDILEQTRLMAMLQKYANDDARVMTNAEALNVATLGGARAILREDELGRLTPGSLADLILVRLDGAHVQPLHNIGAALVYSVRAGDVDTTIVDGRVLMQGRRLLTLDKQQILTEVAKRADRLRDRSHGRKLATYN